ncbi:MAG: glutamyl-tRNA reductase [Gammaproteobacteria bacterium]
MLFAVGVSHKTAPLAVRERLAVAPTRIPELLDALLERDGVDEAVLLATCNRTELYAVAEPRRKRALIAWLGEIGGLGSEPDDWRYVHEDGAAARHLFRVAAGLESMVLGETQVLGQVKTAYLAAHAAAAVGPELHDLFQHALGATKNIRTDSSLDTLRSLPYAAVKLAREKLGGLAGKTALLVGAGDTIETIAFHLRAQNIGRLLIANRSRPAAVALAAAYGGEVLALAELPAAIAASDLVATATSSEAPLIDVASFHARPAGAPLLILDLAVPRDVSPQAAALPDVSVISVDDLAEVIAASSEMRYTAAAEAERAIGRALANWHKARRIRTAVPTICALRAEAAHTRRRTLAEARRIADARGTDAALEYLAATLTNRLMHAPTVRLREAAASDEAALIAAARDLFALGMEDGDQADIEAA